MFFSKSEDSGKKPVVKSRFINIYLNNRKHESMITALKNAYRNSKMINESIRKNERRD
jgi:hypothetical protein